MAGEAVLVVEREEPVRAFLEQQLTDDGFEVLSTEEGQTALELVERARPDLVLLDAVLPDASGFAVCERLRSGEPGRTWNRDVPVIMVSERSEPVDRLRGFARGCDDYVARPFVYEELVARMRAVLRRTANGHHETLAVRDLTVDLASRVVRVGEERVHLSAREYDLLVALAEDPERVFRKEELLRDVWGFRSLGRDLRYTPNAWFFVGVSNADKETTMACDDFDIIEEQAESFLQLGFEPTDSEPGEWLVMEHPDGRVVEIAAEETAEYASRDEWEAAQVG